MHSQNTNALLYYLEIWFVYFRNALLQNHLFTELMIFMLKDESFVMGTPLAKMT